MSVVYKVRAGVQGMSVVYKVRAGVQGMSGCTRYECGQLKKRPVFAAAAAAVHFFARVLYGRLK